MRTGLALVTMLIVAVLGMSVSARKWVDSTGDYSVEAELVGFEDGVVRLKTEDGRMISVPLARLSAADQEYVQHSSIDEPVAEQPAEAQAADSASAEPSGKESAAAEPAIDEPENRPSSNDTQPIPNTGGGLSGLIAWLLWQVYQYFPFEGTWDWLVLFIFVAVVARLATLWKHAQVVRSLEFHKGCSVVVLPVWPYHAFAVTGVMWFFVWFFSTDAGHTFLVGRTWDGGISVLEVNRSLQPSVVFFLYALGFCWLLGWVALGISFDPLFTPLEQPVRAQLVCGLFTCVLPSMFHVLVILAAHAFYWHWSVASLTLMKVFTLVDWGAIIGVALWPGLRPKHGKT